MKESLSEAVYEIVRLIPRGRATSYGAIAKAVGYPNQSRMIGRIMGECPSKDIPAHRVVNSQGLLSGKDCFETPTLMQELLSAEDVIVNNNKIQNWKTIFWNPIEELDF
ncbi:methylated-DNA-protein-cysteine methyltransferase-like protein [Parabacteroides sp. PF5-5]|uniref:MGMT family protein n=1 Tax=unclassified Parabacteroides TaxID=2649774 RepID=UPI002474A750|nr:MULTISPECIES: MGMT family protein [unclassified Parabacteroides]MDH6305038.1 methylated-DNA-protein-cysteine methyltransferase-like protein [Parabacteroides sp. PH5-39]MDH6315877.1 methylated-DNA-protein-cysteine methyltransferase-like protein [Parabacteroides sp. PF5-13]MDH6319534.1 methylated-DNA-protein-cysteine methyltransferase-like protein [Parabacteroides sp. PH5-13]MDH6323265.1 methylated-DNA-protein-cysteine methyltransferase-like protein [Parabacteroides sp. PH5-8]MDH6327227.1 met